MTFVLASEPEERGRMATVVVNTIPDFCKLLARSRLLAPESVESIRKRWQAVARAPAIALAYL